MSHQPSKSNEIEKLRPRVEWIPRSEHEYLQRQKLLPFFRGWVNQIWEAQKPHIEAILEAKDAERIKAVEEERERAAQIVEEMMEDHEYWQPIARRIKDDTPRS